MRDFAALAAVLETIRLVAGFNDMTVMSQAIKKRRCHFAVAKYRWTTPRSSNSL